MYTTRPSFPSPLGLALPPLVLGVLVLVAQVFSTGPAVAVELVIPPVDLAPFEAPQTRPSVAKLPGGFVVVFEEGTRDAGLVVSPPARIAGRDGDAEGVVARLLDVEGRRMGPAFVVNTSTDGSQLCPKVAADPSTGGFVVTWLGQDFSTDPRLRSSLFARRFGIAGSPTTGEIRVAEGPFVECSADLVVGPNGTATIVARGLDGLDVYRLGTGGRVNLADRLSAVRLPDPVSVRLEPQEDGGALLVTAAENDILAIRLDADGFFVGGEGATEVQVGSGLSPDVTVRSIGTPSGPREEAVIASVDFSFTEPTIGLRRFDPRDPVQTSPRSTAVGQWPSLSAFGDDLLLLAATRGAPPGSGDETTGEVALLRLGTDFSEIGAPARIETGFDSWFGDGPVDTAIDGEGRVVAVWERRGTDNLGILGNLALAVFDAVVTADTTAPRLPDPPVAPAPSDDAPQTDHDVAALPALGNGSGGYVIALVEGFSSGGIILPTPPVDGRDGDVEGIVVRVLDADGLPLGEPVVANEVTEGAQIAPAVAADPSTGGFVVAWLDRGEPRLRRFAADGTPCTGEIALAGLQVFSPFEVDVAVDAAGTALVVWEPLDAGTQIFSVAVASDGLVGPTRTLDEFPSGLSRRPSVVALPSGGFFVVFTDENGVQGRRLDADGVPVGGLVPIVGEDLGTVLGLDLFDPARGSDQLLATASASAFGGPVRVFRFDPATGVAETPTFLPSGASPEAVALPSGSVLYGVDTGDGLELRALEIADGAPGPGPATLLPLPSRGPASMAVGASGAALVAYFDGFTEQALVTRVLVDSPRLPLGPGGRFETRVTWRDFDGQTGEGFAVPLSEDTGSFWFFDRENLELTVKVLDGRAINGHYWVFQGSLTNVEYTLDVTDTVTGTTYTVTNPLGQFGSFGDTEAFPSGVTP